MYNTAAGVQGPMRVGNFGQGVNTRLGVGATYYGIMEMSGNVSERTVTVGNATGRGFTGINGNGILDATGNADAANWPGTNAIGAGIRCCNWDFTAIYLRVSGRSLAAKSLSTRDYGNSGRGVRVAP